MAPDEERPTADRIGGVNARSFTGPDMVTWLVYEVDGARVPGARGERCLVFDGGTALRRVWRYPADWRSLGDKELFELSWGR